MSDYITELLVDGAWQNITPDVRDSVPIVLERGRRDWATETDPATMSLRLNNGPSKVSMGVQGRYSARNPRSDLFGKIGRNTLIRVRRDVPRVSFLALPGVVGSYVFAPDAAALDITGDIDIRIEASRDSWQAQDGIFRILAAKTTFAGDDISWAFYLRSDGAPRFTWSTDGSTGARVTVSPNDVIDADAGRIALRVTLDVDNGAAGNAVRFYTSDSIDGTWTQLGSTVVTAGVTSIHSGAGALAVGADSDGNVVFSADSATWDGLVFAFELRDGIAGTLVADPDFTVHEPTARTFTDDAGNTWTLAASAALVDATIRFTGEAKSWPLEWDLSGADRWVKLTAAGITRRLQRGRKPLKSSLFRDLSIKDDVVAYWPLEDVKGASRFNAGRPDDDSFLESFSDVTFAGDDETFFASSPLPTVGSGRITGNVPSYSGADDQRLVFLLSIPADVTWGSEQTLVRIYTSGSIQRWEIAKTAADNTRIRAFDTDGVEVEDTTFVQNLFGVPCAFSVWLQQDGADVDWQLAYFPLDGSQAFAFTDTITGETFGRITRISLGVPGVDFEGTTFGHVFILNDDVQSIWDTIDNSMVGWTGETGLTRLVRLTTDEGLPAVRSIGANDAETMGPQRPLTLMTLLREVPAADLGILSDRPDTLGLQYRNRNDLYSQEPVLVLDYSSGVIAEPFTPVEDDQAIVNEVTVERVRGSSFTAADTTGPLSSLDPPDGVGKLDVSQPLNIDTDGRLPDQAFWRLHLGTIDEPRFPELNLNLRNARAAALEDDILSVTQGAIIRITNPPEWLSGGPYDLLVEAIREEKTAVTHEISFSCSPGSAWTVAVVGDDVLGKADTAGCELDAEFVSGTGTSMDVLTTIGPVWTTDTAELPFEIKTGGVVLNVTAIGAASAGVQTFTVDQTPVNGVTKTIPAGSAVSLAHPAVLAL